MTSHRIDMNPFPASKLVALEPHMTFLQAEESVILAHADIVPRWKRVPLWRTMMFPGSTFWEINTKARHQ
jgi:hypothetical protein